jgi:hypothetical protein
MIKSQWTKLLEQQIELLKKDTVEQAQEEMVDAFYTDESARLELFSNNERVGYKEELSELFDRFQGNYKYEKQIHFSTMAMSL